MNKIVKIFFPLVACLGLFSCKAEVPSESGDSTQSESISAPKFALSESKVTMEKYDTKTLTYIMENIDGRITWSVNNDNVTCVNGVVTAVKIGESVITAVVGDYTSTCTVTVTACTTAAKVVCDYETVTVKASKSFTCDLYATFKDEVVEANFALTYSNPNENQIVTCSYANNAVQFTGIAAGTAKITASARCYDTLLVHQFDVTVIA